MDRSYVGPELGTARIMTAWPYQAMFDTADLVVIAKPISTEETAETIALPNISPEVRVIGLETAFAVSVVLTGNRTDRFVLHHYRLAEPNQLAVALFKQGIPLTAFEVDDIQAEFTRLKGLGWCSRWSPRKPGGSQ